MRVESMASEREVFHLSGPLHLTHIDWENTNYRRSVAACLVQGVCILERDRQEQRLGPEALAPLWWEFFHFRLLRCLIDETDSSIFGAIYEYCPSSPHSADQPHIVVAFRGTMTKKESVSQDLILDLHLIRHGLHRTSRFETAMQTVHNMVAAVGDSRVWLAGHSLGSSIAMLAGKNMARSGMFLQSFLFNPPYVSAPLEQIKGPKLKHGLRLANTLVTAGLAFALKTRKHAQQQLSRAENRFAVLSAWFPNLFVNLADPICSEYIGYFERRKMMVEMGAGAIERLAAQQSIGSLVMTAMGKETEVVQFVPSATLVVNAAPYLDFKTAHGLHQWWQPDTRLQARIYNYS